MNHVEPLDSYLQLLEYCQAHYAREPFMTDAVGVWNYADFIRLVREYAALLPDAPQTYVVPASASQIRYAAAYFAIVLRGHIAVLQPGGHELPSSLQGALRLTDEFLERAAGQAEAPALDSLRPLDPGACCTIAFSSGTSSAGTQQKSRSIRSLSSSSQPWNTSPAGRVSPSARRTL